ncbi:hypothetical protein GQR58_020547 [Nymphon striatum]|nr:hypothetical protein GQR58_020547 [Nymphon striatum]
MQRLSKEQVQDEEVEESEHSESGKESEHDSEYDYYVLAEIGVFLLGSSVFFCVQRSRETTKAVQRAHASYDVTQAQVPQYPVAVVPGPITMAGTQLPPGSYAADPPSYYLASAPNATPYYPESGSQPPEFSEVPPVETKM